MDEAWLRSFLEEHNRPSTPEGLRNLELEDVASVIDSTWKLQGGRSPVRNLERDAAIAYAVWYLQEHGWSARAAHRWIGEQLSRSPEAIRAACNRAKRLNLHKFACSRYLPMH